MCSNNSFLLDATKELLISKNRDITYKQIAEATKIDETWIKRFASRRSISNPSVVRIEKLYNFLSGKQLAEQLAI